MLCIRHLLSSLLIIGTVFCTSAQLCSIDIVQETVHPCRGDVVSLTVHPGQEELNVPLDTLNGLRGVMFDVQVNKTVNLNAFSVRPRDTTTIEVWYKVGSYDGWETASGAWTFLQSWANVAPESTPVKLALDVPVSVPAGQVYGIYLTSTDPTISIDYSKGSAVGDIVAFDSNIEILEGAGLDYPFGGSGSLVFEPRRFYGSVWYSAVPDLTWSTGAMTTTINTIADAPQWISATADFAELGCSTTDSIRVFGFPEMVLPAAATLCTDQSITLDAGPGIGSGYTYLWTTGETGEFLTLNGTDFSAGDYVFTVAIDDGLGCTATDAVTLSVITPPESALPESIEVCSDEIVELNPGISEDFDFLWSDGSEDATLILDASTLPLGVSTFGVDITQGDGCLVSDQVELIVSICSGLDIPENSPMVWPNPVSSFLQIEGVQLGTEWQLFDLTGSMLNHGMLQNQIDLSAVPAGVYFLQFEGFAPVKVLK